MEVCLSLNRLRLRLGGLLWVMGLRVGSLRHLLWVLLAGLGLLGGLGCIGRCLLGNLLGLLKGILLELL